MKTVEIDGARSLVASPKLMRRDGAPPKEVVTTHDDVAPPDSTGTAANDAVVPGTAAKKPGMMQGMMAKVGTKLSDSVIYTQYGYRPPNLILGAYGGIGTELKIKPVKPDDGLIKNDPNRTRYNERMAKEGKGVSWAEVRGAVNPWVGIPLWTPIGPVNASVGFSADGTVGVSIISPYQHDVPEAAKNLTWKLPLAAETARELSEGTEVAVRGRGRLAVSAGVRVGDSWVPIRGPWSVGTSIGVDTYVTTERELGVRVKRLDGNKVLVSLSDVSTDAGGVVGSVRAGVHGSINPALPDYQNQYAEKGKGIVGKAISREIERWLSLEAKVVHSRSSSEKELKNYVLDLDDPAAAKAYEALMTLDTRLADALSAEGPESGIRAVWLTEKSKVVSTGYDARFGKIDLVSGLASAEVAQGQLFMPEGVIDFDRASLEHRYQNIVTRWWAGKRETNREFTSANGKEQMHLRHEITVDASTPRSHVRSFLILSRYMGMRDASDGLEQDKTLLKSFGTSKEIVDFNLNAKGLATLLAATPDQLHAAFAKAYEEMDQPTDMFHLFAWEEGRAWKNTPWLAKDHPKHSEIIKLLEDGPEGAKSHEDGQTRDEQYYWITGRLLYQDSTAYDEAHTLVALIAKLREAKTPTARAKVMGDARTRLGVDSLHELATFAQIVGRDGLRVHQLSLEEKGNKRNLKFDSDGPMIDFRNSLDGWLQDPVKGPAKK